MKDHRLAIQMPKPACCSILHVVLLNLLLWGHKYMSAAISFSNHTDKLALLDFKNHITQDPMGILNSWNESQHFCQWQGVRCSRRHERVIALNLGGHGLFGEVPPSIGNLSFLQAINLQDNSFHGELPSEIGRLFRLKQLNMTNNTLGGEIPANLSSCVELAIIDLFMNNLVGSIPPELGSLKNLLRLMIATNNLTGSIPTSIGNLTSLRQISVAENNIEGSIPSEIGRLKSLAFFAVGINNLSGTLPPSLFNISTLSVFSTADNQFTGSLPTDIGRTLPNLLYFGLGQNQFSGTIPVSIINATQLQLLDLPENNFVGLAPSHLGNLQNLQRLNLGNNFLGNNKTNDLSFITSLSNCSSLGILYLNDNNFGGEIPNTIGNLSNQLSELSLGGNHLTGTIPTGIENLSQLFVLATPKNLLSGTIPSYLGKFQNLQSLLLYGNNFYGQIPSSLGNITQLWRLRLQSNGLQGSIPSSIGNCQNLNVMDISQNLLTGLIPTQVISISSLTTSLNLSRNSLNGSLPQEVGTLKNINSLDVSENKLSGEIPETIGDCSSLEYLYLQGNQFQGIIPSPLASLKGIRELDLSRNNLSKSIPKELASLPFLQYLNLSFNELEGEVPKDGIFNNASRVSVVGNSQLCGGIPDLQLPPCPAQVNNHRRPVSRLHVIAIASATVFCIGIISFAILYWRRRGRKDKETLSRDSSMDHILRISYNELNHATGGFSPDKLIGSGSFGSVYEGMLNQLEGRLVAVKVLNLQNHNASKSFVAECRALRNIRHKNIVKILTYCSSIDFNGNDFMALVYEFMPNGSLDRWLHPAEVGNLGRSRSLTFLQRLNIAIDVASALQYVHHLCETPIIHCDLKPSNILLDSDLIAHISDFGLSRLLPDTTSSILEEQSSSIGIKGTTGYAAPEYGMGRDASTSGDVYSYGILLLEMITGRRPTDGIFKDGLVIHDYCKNALPNHVIDIVDPVIIANRGSNIEQENEDEDDDDIEEEEKGNTNNGISSPGRDNLLECVASVLEIGLAASEILPTSRVDINHVLRGLQIIREKFLGARMRENNRHGPR